MFALPKAPSKAFTGRGNVYTTETRAHLYRWTAHHGKGPHAPQGLARPLPVAGKPAVPPTSYHYVPSFMKRQRLLARYP